MNTRICTLCAKSSSGRWARGLCSGCYQKQRRLGGLAAFESTNDMDIAGRLKHYSVPNPANGCIEWVGSKCNGYGVLGTKDSFVVAHRAAWSLANDGADIPEGMFVCHRCDNPKCINPKHLFLGTPKDNSQDMSAKGRSTRGERSASALLTPEQVLAIRQDQRSQRRIAVDYGVSPRCIGKAKRRDTWAHI